MKNKTKITTCSKEKRKKATNKVGSALVELNQGHKSHKFLRAFKSETAYIFTQTKVQYRPF